MRTRSLPLFAALLGLLVPGTASSGELKRPHPFADTRCARHGPGFVAVSGTTTCMRVGGRVRAGATSAPGRAPDGAGAFGAGGRVSVDTRTETGVGPVRTFVRVGAGRP